MSARRYRTQEVAGSSPASSILKPMQSPGLLTSHQRTLFVFVLPAFSRDNRQFLRVYVKPLRHTRL